MIKTLLKPYEKRKKNTTIKTQAGRLDGQKQNIDLGPWGGPKPGKSLAWGEISLAGGPDQGPKKRNIKHPKIDDFEADSDPASWAPNPPQNRRLNQPRRPIRRPFRDHLLVPQKT